MLHSTDPSAHEREYSLTNLPPDLLAAQLRLSELLGVVTGLEVQLEYYAPTSYPNRYGRYESFEHWRRSAMHKLVFVRTEIAFLRHWIDGYFDEEDEGAASGSAIKVQNPRVQQLSMA